MRAWLYRNGSKVKRWLAKERCVAKRNGSQERWVAKERRV